MFSHPWDGEPWAGQEGQADYTVQTVAADLRQGEHIPKMQNNIGRKSMLRVLRQLKSKDGGGGCRAAPAALAVPDISRRLSASFGKLSRPRMCLSYYVDYPLIV